MDISAALSFILDFFVGVVTNSTFILCGAFMVVCSLFGVVRRLM